MHADERETGQWLGQVPHQPKHSEAGALEVW